MTENVVQDSSSPSQPPQAEDPIGILPGITQFLSQQMRSLIQPLEAKEAPEIIEAAGFRSEVHKVTTEDGYILTMHRYHPHLHIACIIMIHLGWGRVLAPWSFSSTV